MIDSSFYLYKVFCVVVETKNYKKASEILFVSEPTISTHIKNLEQKLGMTLFYRERDGLILTKEGRMLYDYMNNRIKDIEFAEESFIQDNNISKSKITIGCPSHIAVSYLAKCIVNAKKDYPDLQVNLISTADYSGLIEKLQKHIVDFVIMDIVPPEAKNEIIVSPLHNMENIFVYNQPLKINELKELEHYSFILNYKNSFSTKELFEILKQHNVKIRADLQSDITEMRIEETKLGLGIGYVMK